MKGKIIKVLYNIIRERSTNETEESVERSHAVIDVWGILASSSSDMLCECELPSYSFGQSVRCIKHQKGWPSSTTAALYNNTAGLDHINNKICDSSVCFALCGTVMRDVHNFSHFILMMAMTADIVCDFRK